MTDGFVPDLLNRGLLEGNAGIIVGDVTQTTPATIARIAGATHTFEVSRHPSGQGPVRVDTTNGQPIARFEPLTAGRVLIVDCAEPRLNRTVDGDPWAVAVAHAEGCAALDDDLLPF